MNDASHTASFALVLKTVFCTVAVLFIGLGSVKAQNTEVGFGVGTLTYTGDLADRGFYSDPSLAFNFMIRRRIRDFLTMRAQLLVGGIQGFDGEDPNVFPFDRGAAFRSVLYELSPVLEYHFYEYRGRRGIHKFSPYLFGGIGFTGYFGESRKAKVETGDLGQEYLAWDIEDYSRFITPTLPFGAGIKMSLSRSIDLNLEFGARKMFTDKLDNVGDGDLLISPTKVSAPNGNLDDWYYFAGFSFSYIIWKVQCPHNFY